MDAAYMALWQSGKEEDETMQSKNRAKRSLCIKVHTIFLHSLAHCDHLKGDE